MRAELYRLAGGFLINYGKAKNLPNFQLRGKDALTKAIEDFWTLKESEKALEAQMLLAIAYYNEGSINEYQALLDDAESYFAARKSHPVYLLIQINYLVIAISREEPDQALLKINEISELVKKSNEQKIRIFFFTQAGIVYRLLGKYEEALFYLKRALKNSQTLKIYHY
jgi:tetratricopeptide (TPR) repeat protein